jgi:hypothetical protein
MKHSYSAVIAFVIFWFSLEACACIVAGQEQPQWVAISDSIVATVAGNAKRRPRVVSGDALP